MLVLSLYQIITGGVFSPQSITDKLVANNLLLNKKKSENVFFKIHHDSNNSTGPSLYRMVKTDGPAGPRNLRISGFPNQKFWLLKKNISLVYKK